MEDGLATSAVFDEARNSISALEPSRAPKKKAIRKAYVVGNCQVKSLAHALNYYCDDIDFDHVQIHSLHPSKAEAFINSRIKEIRSDADLILTMPLSAKFFGLATDEIKNTFPDTPVLTISNLYFAGYHPDIVVLGIPHKRIDGPLDQYRSRIALYGYMKGINVESTTSLYCSETYALLDYFSHWPASMGRMLKADESVDIPFARTFEALLRRRLAVYVPNHPTPAVFKSWAKTLVSGLEERGLASIRAWEPDEALLPALFTDAAVFPVYPEIATHHGLDFAGSYVFKSKGYRTNAFMALGEYVAIEFAAFEEAGRDAIRSSEQWPGAEQRCSVLDRYTGQAT